MEVSNNNTREWFYQDADSIYKNKATLVDKVWIGKELHTRYIRFNERQQ